MPLDPSAPAAPVEPMHDDEVYFTLIGTPGRPRPKPRLIPGRHAALWSLPPRELERVSRKLRAAYLDRALLRNR